METFPSGAERQVADMPERVHLRGWALTTVLGGLMLTLLLSALDQTIVNTAMPRIVADLQGADRYVWPATAYLLASTTMIPIVGKLSDLFGRKWFLVAGVVIFLTGSALSGASQTMNQLIGFRGLQGIGGGVLMSLVFTLVGDIFPPAERARWQGLFSGVFALASVIGPAAGGYITDHYTWRWIFYVNLPIGFLALTALVRWLPTNISPRSTRYTGWAAIRRIDFLGAATASAATICLILGLTWGAYQIYAWSSTPVLATLAGAAVLYPAFFLIERVAVEPILPLDLFRNQVFAAGALLALTVGMALLAVAFYLPLFMQGVLGQSATNSGALITPLTVTMAIGAAIIGQVIAKVGRYQFSAVIGALIMVAGAFLLTQLAPTTSLLEVTRDMVVLGLGLGMLQPVMTLAVQNAIPRNRLGVGTGAVTYLRSTGSTLGVALVGSVEFSTYSDELARRLPAAAHPFAAQLTAQNLQYILTAPGIKQQVVQQATQRASLAALHQSLPQAVAQAEQGIIAQGVARAEQAAIAQGVARAAANVPAGPQHDAIVAQITKQVTAQVTAQEPQIRAQVTAQVLATQDARIHLQVAAHIVAGVTQQVTTLFNQVFEAARQALAVGIEHGFWVGLGVCVAMFGITLFLKDVPLQTRQQGAQAAQAVRQALAEQEPVAVPVDSLARQAPQGL
jgi:EmrB/QacA subfamily drug resistance transporter